jgi:hypothetical protein
MTVLCDFIQIIGDSPVTIGDSNPVWEQTFSTGGRDLDGTAFLIFNIRGLTFADATVNVTVNDTIVGSIAPYGGLTTAERDDVAKYYYTQMISLTGAQLKSTGNNEIQIEAVGWSGATNTNKFDDFQLKNMMCFFHQAD